MLITSQAWKDAIYTGTDKRIRFIVGDTTLTDDNIQGIVELQETCTNSADIKIGSCIASMLKFNVTNNDQNRNLVKDLNMTVNEMLMLVNELGNTKSINFLNEISVQVGIKISSSTYEYVPLGLFNVDSIDDKDEKVFKITCRDRMKLFDKDCTEFLTNVQYPISLFNFTKELCTYVGIELANTNILNGNYLIEENFNASDITGLQILSWIGEVAGSFVNVNRYGKLVFKTFTNATNSFTGKDYINIDISRYTVPQITRVQIAVQENDLGIVVGSGNVTYSIINNPLLYTKSEEAIVPVANSILTQLKSIPIYYPAKAYGKGNPAIEAGDIFKVNTVKGQEVDVIVMDRKFVYQKSFRDTYESFGTITNGEKKIVNSNILQSKGKMNIFKRELGMNQLKIVDLEIGYSEILQTVDSITLTVANNKVEVDGKITTLVSNISQIDQKADSISLSVSQNKTWAEGQFTLVRENIATIDIKADGIVSTVSSQGQRIDNNTNQIAVNIQEISRVEQKADSIQSSVSLRIDGVETNLSTISQKADSIQTTVTTHTGQISQITQTSNSIEARINNTKVKLTEADGITVYNGGFKIVTSSDNIQRFKTDVNGNVLSRGLYVVNPSLASYSDLNTGLSTMLKVTGGFNGEVIIGSSDYSLYHFKASAGTGATHYFAGDIQLGRESVDDVYVKGSTFTVDCYSISIGKSYNTVNLGEANCTVKIKGYTVKWEYINGKYYLVQV